MPSSAEVERSLSQARDLQAWWSGVESGRNAIERFDLAPAPNQGDSLYGFHGEAVVGGLVTPVMGYDGDYFFDCAPVEPAEESRAVEWMVAQVEEFALRYWLRTQTWALPQLYPRINTLDPPGSTNPSSPVPSGGPQLTGIYNIQSGYKLRGSGATGEFPASDAHAFIDLREMESRYAWVTLQRFNLNSGLSITVGGEDQSMNVSLPLFSGRTMPMSSDLTTRVRQSHPGVAGEFGPGFAQMDLPGYAQVANSLDMLQPCLRLQTLRVTGSVEVRLRTVAIMPRAGGIAKEVIEAAAVCADGVNRLTHGMAREAAGDISVRRAEQFMLTNESIQLRDSLLATRSAWQEVPDWLDASGIPAWIAKGRTV